MYRELMKYFIWVKAPQLFRQWLSLILLRNDSRFMWNFLYRGGRAEPGEGDDAAASRAGRKQDISACSWRNVIECVFERLCLWIYLYRPANWIENVPWIPNVIKLLYLFCLFWNHCNRRFTSDCFLDCTRFLI